MEKEKITNIKLSAGVILDINRDSEVLNQFVRVNIDEPEVIEGGFIAPKVPDAAAIIKALTAKVKIEEQNEELEQEKQQERSQERRSSMQRRKSIAKIDQTQLNRELSKKKRRKRPKPEEVYTDKDRAAAVNMGTKDIKQSLKIKMREDRSRLFQIPQEAKPSTFLALGTYEMIKEEPDTALGFLNKALELNPTEKNSLVARSKCYLLLGQPENGLKDAEAALSIDINFIKGIYQKAEALYYLGDFEHSLMYYHRGLRIRPEHEGFQLGVHKAQKAIENAIGVAFPGVKRTQTANSTEKSSSKSRITTPSTSKSPDTSKTQTSAQRNTPNVKMKAVNKNNLLRELKTDKEYLDALLQHPHLKCKNKEDDSAIVGCVQGALEFLNKRQEFWRQQLPNKK